MNKRIFLHCLVVLLCFSSLSFARTPLTDTIPLRDRTGDYLRDSIVNPFNLRDPSIIEKSVEYDPKTNRYIITEKIGDDYYRAPSYMTFEEYVKWKAKQQERDYFERLAGISKRRSGGEPIDPLSRINFDQTQNSKLKLLLKTVGVNGKLPEVPKLDIKRMGDNLIGMIFGDPPTVDIRPQGQIDLTLGGDYRYFGNPILPIFARRNGGLLFNMDIQMNVTGKIGEKLNLNTSFNNKATFDFDNIMKINYNSNVFNEDDIIKSIEGGNVSLPLRGSLIQGSQNLFGVKTELQFGNLRLTALAAQQRNRRQSMQVQGGSQLQQFNVPIDQYDENRHFFLTHFNRNTFEKALETMPLINSQFSITKLEVWVSSVLSNDQLEKEVRQIVALADIGEGDTLNNADGIRLKPGAPRDLDGKYHIPDNLQANDLYERILRDTAAGIRRIDRVVNMLQAGQYRLEQGRDFIKRSAKRLQASEYTFNPKLGTLSINNIDRQQIVGVAFTYFYNGQGPFQVGEFGENVPMTDRDSQSQVIFLKMLKNQSQDPRFPLFDLMMKNVYSIGAYVNSPQDLQLDIIYQDASEGNPDDKAEKRALAELPKKPLLRLLNLDRLNISGDPQPDGQFDFVPEVTINTRTGRIMFPKLEPFGSSLRQQLIEREKLDPSVADKYTYQVLYDSTLFRAQERQERNRFFIRGRVKSSASNRIQLNAFGLRPGAVTVSAGAFQLIEGVDYAIDYGTSVLTVLNPAYVQPNIPLNISYEDNALFGLQTRTMLGVRADYQYKKKYNIGATFMNLFEIPYTRKVNYGDDPINNKVYGLDLNFTEDAPWLTKLVDKIPLIQTKEPSKITFTAEGAVLRPGHSKAINIGQDKGGAVYVDDFEGSSAPFSLTAQPNAWVLASVPQRNPLFPESQDTALGSGVNRASLNWYRIDQFIRDKSAGSDSDPYTAFVNINDVFPNRDPNSQLNFGGGLPTFDMTYYPEERGPYNFDLPPSDPKKSVFSRGINNNGGLIDPKTRWSGIMRSITTTDFEAANVEYIDLWIMSPYLKPERNPGKGNIYLHLGDVSEDILKDSRRSYENGLPSPQNPDLKTDITPWGRVPRTEIPLPNSFGVEQDRAVQDVGLDGITSAEEKVQFADYLNRVRNSLNNAAFQRVENDPSNDDFIYYNDEKAYPNGTNLLRRYSRFNGLEGNSASNAGFQVQSATNIPDAEDVNRDNSFDEGEAYFQYRIPLSPLGNGIDTINTNFYIENIKDRSNRIWYHFRVPIDQYERKFGQINDFRGIRFIRMIVKDFEDTTTLRFAKFDLIRNQWRRFKEVISVPGINVNLDSEGSLELNAVNIEENSARTPFQYVLPPGILREIIPNSFAANAQQNEQALALTFKSLQKNQGRAAFKLLSMDMRIYERLKMFVHAENRTEGVNLNGKMCIFMRIGTDFTNNYYEYEIPLTMSDPDSARLLRPNPLAILVSDDYKKEVWREENSFDFPLALLTQVKTERNQKGTLGSVYEIADPFKVGNKIKVRGNPDLGNVKGVMVGVVNKDPNGVAHDIEVWINELRVTGLNESTSGAAIARLDFKLADLGNVSVSGNFMGIGYGAIDQRLIQRSREEVKEYSLNGNFELGKFFPQSSGIRIPFNVQYSNNIRTPEYDPYDLDVKLKDRLTSETDGEKRKEIKENALTVQEIKGYSFNNVRKDRTGNGKPMPWNIENFSASYGYTELERRDPIVENDFRQNYKGSLDYNYSMEPKYITPLKKIVKSESKAAKYLKLFTDFNFNPIPNTVGFNTILDRQLNTTRYRFSGEDPAFNTFYQRRFGWDRNYNLQWDLARALKFNFDAKTFAIIDELNDFNDNGDPIDATDKKAYISRNLRDFGRTKRYDQNINVNYTVPTRNIPFMEWVNVRATYGASYGWEAFSFNPNNDEIFKFRDIGNFINNRQSRQANADLNFDQLYGYVKYLKKIQTPRPASQNVKEKRKKKSDADTPPSVENPPKPDVTAAQDTVKGKKAKKKKEGEYEPSMAERILIRPLLTLRKARFNFTETYNSYVPGFTAQAGMFGMQDLAAPGWDYALGLRQADDDWLENARTRNWISTDYRQTRPLLNNYSQQYDARVTLEPFQDFRVEMDMTKNFVKNHSEEFRNPSAKVRSIDSIRSFNRFDEGSYTVSYFTANTFFKNIDEVFNKFVNNRPLMSNILNPTGGAHGEYQGYKQGYGPTNQDVLIPSFIAAYTGKDLSQVNKDVFKQRPALNWRLTYNGLAKLPGLKNIFSSINITHGYKSTLTVNQFRTEPFYDSNNPTKTVLENPYDYYTQFDIPTVVITEQFAPLFGVDVNLKSGATFGVSYRKSRNLGLSISDTRLQETNTKDLTVKFGHRLKNVYIKFLDFDLEKKKKKPTKADKEKQEAEAAKNQDPNAPKKKREPKPKKGNDLVLNFDLTFRDDISLSHLLGPGTEVPTRGNKTIRVAPSATYTVNRRLDLRFYVDYNQIIPYTTASFNTINASGGFVITFKLN